MAEHEILCERRGAAGVIRLNRPRALNALTSDMVADMAAALDRFEADDAVQRVLVTGAGDRAFCAGGDIRLMHDLGKAGDHEAQLAFWRDEYRLNLRMAEFSKPIVALIDGFVMGGGVGVSAHATYQVAGDRYLFAMPEVVIGFFPDVGGTYVLPRLPYCAGYWLALTGSRIGAGDAAALGLVTHVVPSAGVEALTAALEAPGETSAILAAHAVAAPPAAHAAEWELMAEVFSADSLPEILARLERHADRPFAQETLAQLRRVSPTSLALALRQMREGGQLSLAEALKLEFRIVSRICRGADFYEGVRAQIVDRDNRPLWSPARIEDLSAQVTDAYWAQLGPDELTFPRRA